MRSNQLSYPALSCGGWPRITRWIVEVDGFEPPLRGPESLVLPLHHTSLSGLCPVGIGTAKVGKVFGFATNFSFFSHDVPFDDLCAFAELETVGTVGEGATGEGAVAAVADRLFDSA